MLKIYGFCRKKLLLFIIIFFFFKLQYSLSVKQEEKKRLEEELRNEEIILQKMESELRLAEQAFDQFLQENDRKAVGAMKR